MADTVIGSDSEFAAAGLTPAEVVAAGVRRVFVKHGPAGASLIEDGADARTSRACRCPWSTGSARGMRSRRRSARACCAACRGKRLLQVGNAAGAIVATRLSCSSAMPDWSEVESMADDPAAWTHG